MQMADPTQFQQLSEKLDDIRETVSRLELKLEERGGAMHDFVHAETNLLRKEFNDFKGVISEKVTTTSVKLGFIFSIVMIIVSAAIAAYIKQ